MGLISTVKFGIIIRFNFSKTKILKAFTPKIILPALLLLLSFAMGIWYINAPGSSAADVEVRLVIPSPTCGNGIKEGDYEECDDGNLINGDGCDNVCYFEVCGNGVLQINEECDDANVTDGDGCDSQCYNEVCGNGRVQSGEQCDDGNTTDGDGCNSSCVFEVCGDGTLTPSSGEECDDGNLTDGDGCDSQCYNEVCGNSRIQSGEACDDGNTADADGCSSTCTVESGYTCVGTPSCCSVCGDAVTQCNEQCDDGKHCVNGNSCTTDLECFGIGDNLCTVRSGDGCSATCTSESGGGGSSPQEIIISEITAYPEQRSGATGSNYDTTYAFSILDANDQSHAVYYSHPILQNTTNVGIGYPYMYISGMNAGVYDTAFKTKAHLTAIQDNVFLQLGENSINYTNPTNQVSIGSVRLVAGDINGAGTSPGTLGDDVINSVDISVLLNRFGASDPSGNSVRANLNQDSSVNQTDLDILLNNLDKEVNL